MMTVLNTPLRVPMRSLCVAFFVGLFTLIIAATGLVASSAWAEPKYPDLNNQRVVDQANLLTPEARQDLELKLKDLEDATTDQMVIVTVKSLDGYDIADYGYQLGRHWGIGQNGTITSANGQKYKDNGLLLIVAPNERKVRIEVGYGLEPVMTDAMSSLIIQRAILPHFKTGDYSAGINAGTDSIIAQLSLDRGVAIQKAQAAAQNARTIDKIDPLSGLVIFVLIIIFLFFSRGWLPFLILNSLLNSGGGNDWGGGGGGGGGGGFSGGGGSFGGGGSSGGW